MEGVSITNSNSNFIFGNHIESFKTGVLVQGRPNSGSIIGGSYNGIGAVPPYLSHSGNWSEEGNNFISNQTSVLLKNAGWNNSLRSNKTETQRGGQCDLRGGLNSTNQDWTTGNSLNSCNENY